jgi:hypothetical protein
LPQRSGDIDKFGDGKKLLIYLGLTDIPFMTSFTLVSVHHEDPTPNAILTASIWIASGDRRADIADELPTEAKGWCKISDPIDLDVAVNVCSRLADFLSQNGLHIINKTIAD